ncbi:adhesion G-protein coupled receptor G4-like [Chaetodon auriga]|uniref:adhesion G-protein coupled receptor G4-like n=1 Tax=Chaetodon auriga TaxID=39042 RepID=UPI004032A4FF
MFYPWVSPWGKVADFTYECNHWRLKPQVSIPALQGLTVCFNLKLKVQASLPWTAFMYRHPEVQCTELGLGGKWGRLVVWLFGMEWTTDQMNLDVSHWYSLCLTWTHTKDRPALYINGEPVDIMAAHSSAPSISPLCCKLAPSGTLTLGAAHRLVNGSIQIIPFTGLLGKVSQFRIWGRERSKEEVTSLRCTEGDLVTWGRDDWDAQICGPLPDSSLYCEWSIYEVRLMFAIIRFDGNNTELRTARDIAHRWLELVLPSSVYLHEVSVFEVSSKLCLRTHWLLPDLEDCSLLVESISDLEHVNVTADTDLHRLCDLSPENVLDVVGMIEGLLSNQSTLKYQELVTVLDKLEDVVNRSVITPNLGQALINIVSDILESDSNLLPFTNTILNITEAVGDKLVGYNGSSTLVAPAIAISVVDVVPGQFGSLTFGVSSDRTGTRPEIFINRYPFNSTVAFISLPSVLQHSFPENDRNQSTPRVLFQFYGIPMLFRSREKGQTLNTFVVSASVTNASSPIKDLDEDVQVTLHHLAPNALYKDEQCVYWNFNKNNGHGGWDDYGCRKYNSSLDYTTCLCDHLTHFAVLLDVSRTQVGLANEKILTIITYVGCGVSSLFLGITVLTYTAFEKLRRDYPSQILMNLSLALLGLNLVFLVNSWLSSWGLYGLCVAVAFTLHYFLLASLTWMGLEAVNMYLALVKVFNVYVPSYILKFCTLGWGIPLVICTLVLIVNREAYGSHLYTDAQPSFEPTDISDDFCWLQDDVTFYVSVVAFAILVFLFNITVFVLVLIQIRHMRVNSPAGIRSGLMHDLRGVASLTLLLGLTWTVGFFTWGPARTVLLYLFSALNSLQGLFIFLFHCLMKENVRKQWRSHLCFGSSALKSILSGATPHQLESWPSHDQILQEHQHPWSTQSSPAPQTALPLPPTAARETDPAKDQTRAFL